MSTYVYNCPCCGAPLAYDAANKNLKCASCGNSYELEALEAMKPAESDGGVRFDLPQETFNASEAAQMQAYICKGCGAELLTDDTTTATECPYCGSPTILPDRIDGSVKPEMVIPFTVTKEQAQKQFEEYFHGKILLPNIFKNSRNRITEMRKLYVPYWLFDCDAQGNIVYDAEKKSTSRQGDYEIENIEHYIVRRAGSMYFENIPVDGSEKLDNKITESLEPYDLSAAVPFQPAVLAGAMADHADVDAAACEGRAVERVENSMASELRDTVKGYSSVRERSKNIFAEGGKVTPVLMPVWLITTEKDGKTYTFAINGQTGKLTCDVPSNKGMAFGIGASVFAGVFGIAALVMHLLEKLGSGTALMAALIAFIAAFSVVAVLLGQLKQAVKQSSAANYVKKGSFNLSIRYDKYLYTTTNRRKIESSNK